MLWGGTVGYIRHSPIPRDSGCDIHGLLATN